MRHRDRIDRVPRNAESGETRAGGRGAVEKNSAHLCVGAVAQHDPALAPSPRAKGITRTHKDQFTHETLNPQPAQKEPAKGTKISRLRAG